LFLKGDSYGGKNLLSTCSESVTITPDGDYASLPQQDQIPSVNVNTSINCENVDKSLNCEVGVDQPGMASADKVPVVVDGTLATTSAFSQPLVCPVVQIQSNSKFLFWFSLGIQLCFFVCSFMILSVHDYFFYVYLSTSKGTSHIAGVSQGQAPPTSVVQTSTNICKDREG
jgi:hypothetical protein